MYMLSSSNYKILIVQKIFYQLLCYRHILSFFQFILKTVYFNEIIQILAVEHCQRSGNNLKQHAAGRLNQHHDTLCYIFTASLLHISTYAHLFLRFGLINSEQLQIVESHRVFLSQNNQKYGEFAKVVEKAMNVKTDFQITSSTNAKSHLHTEYREEYRPFTVTHNSSCRQLHLIGNTAIQIKII